MGQNRRNYKILLHVAGWLLFLSWPFLFDSHNPNRHRDSYSFSFWIPMIVSNIFLLGLFYLNIFVLIPRILRTRGWTFYLASVVICFLIYSYTVSALREQYFPRRPFTERSATYNRESSGSPGEPRFSSGPPLFPRFPHFFNLVPFLLVFGLSTSLKFSEDITAYDRERKDKENENLKSELSLLRSQISPHFMFNVLNSLAAMARKKSDRIEEAIINLSQLMRYMLYESASKKATLGEELEYLGNYIDLQLLRFGSSVNVRLDKENANRELLIEPMLLIPFVENAFKHGVGLISQPEIFISISSSNQTITFEVKNKVASMPQEQDKTPGIGLQNVKRRLELLYPGKFSLTVGRVNDWYESRLILTTGA